MTVREHLKPSPWNEVLLTHPGENRRGASYLLRSLATEMLAKLPGCRIAIACATDRDTEHHVSDTGGLRDLLGRQSDQGLLRWKPGFIQVPRTGVGNDSVLHLTSWKGAAQRDLDVVFLDDADDLTYAEYQVILSHIMNTECRVSKAPRVVLVARKAVGWQRTYFGPANRKHGRTILELADTLPDDLAQREATQTILSYRDFASLVAPDFIWFDHCCALADEIQMIADGDTDYLSIHAPPRYGKTAQVGEMWPAYFLHRHPDRMFAYGTATDRLGRKTSKKARAYYVESGGKLLHGSQDAAMWHTARGGGMWIRGVSAGILGEGWDAAAVDDPFGSRLEAQRVNVQEMVFEWFNEDFLKRQNRVPAFHRPLVMMHQRLAQLDLIGRLYLAEELAPFNWRILNLPAVKRERKYVFPSTCTVIEDNRKEGEPLCEAFHTIEELNELERRNAYTFSALYLQDPMPSKGGGLIHRDWLNLIGEPIPEHTNLTEWIAYLQGDPDEDDKDDEWEGLPIFVRECRSWDFATTDDPSADATASTRMGSTDDHRVMFTDATKHRLEPAGVEHLVMEKALDDGHGVDIVLPKEPATAKGWILGLANKLRDLGFNLGQEPYTQIHIVSTMGSKRSRFMGLAGASKPAEADQLGRVYFLRGGWNDWVAEEFHLFDGEKGNLDVGDAAAYGFNWLEELRPSAPLPFRRLKLGPRGSRRRR